MYIILKLVYENFSSIAVKISFLWGPKHGVYAAPSRHFQQTCRRDAHVTTCTFLLPLYEDLIYRTVTV